MYYTCVFVFQKLCSAHDGWWSAILGMNASPTKYGWIRVHMHLSLSLNIHNIHQICLSYKAGEKQNSPQFWTFGPKPRTTIHLFQSARYNSKTCSGAAPYDTLGPSPDPKLRIKSTTSRSCSSQRSACSSNHSWDVEKNCTWILKKHESKGYENKTQHT